MLKTLFQPIYSVYLPPPGSFDNQTVLVTGSNIGVGLETVRHAVSLGASNIIMGVRSKQKGEMAREDILSSVPADIAAKTNIEVWQIDMSSFQSVMGFIHRMRDYVSHPGNKLDTAILNAGLASAKWEITPDGWEKQIQVNGLSTALLGLELLPILISSSDAAEAAQKQNTGMQQTQRRPHLVIVASDMHQQVKIPQRSASNILDALNNKEQWADAQAVYPAERYAVSKLFSQWINIELSKLVPVDPQTGKEKVTVTSVTPGFTKSELLTREEGLPALFRIVKAISARKPVDGAKPIVDAAVREDGHGKWLENHRVTDPGYIVSSPEGQKIQEQAWGETLTVLKQVDPDLKLNYS